MKNGLKHFLIALILLMAFFSQKGSTQGEEKEPAPPSQKGFGIAISPSVIRLSSKPGQSQRATVRVLNNGLTPTQVVTEVNDVGNIVDQEGKLSRQFFPPGTLPFSCAKWALLQDQEFKLASEEHKDVTFLISSPAESSGGSACVIFFRGIPLVETEVPQEPAEARTTIQIQPRLGAMVFYEIEGTIQRTGSLLSLAHEPPTPTSPLRILYVFKNSGNADILITGTFYVLDQNKTLVAKGDLTPLRTFPGDEGGSETEWTGALPQGTYRLVVTFELGPDAQEVIVKELDFTVA